MPDTTVVTRRKPGRPKRKPKKVYRKKKGAASALAVRTARTVRRIAKKVDGARHFVDVASVFANMDDSAEAAVLLNGVAQGDDEQKRNGDQIKGSYLVVRGTLFRAAAANQLSDICRIVVVRDKMQRSDTAPAYTDVFQNASWQAHMNWQNRGRFELLYDKIFEIDANNPSQTFRAIIPTPYKVRFNGSASTDIERNGIYIMGIGSDATAGGDGPQLSYNTRFVFFDN